MPNMNSTKERLMMTVTPEVRKRFLAKFSLTVIKFTAKVLEMGVRGKRIGGNQSTTQC